MHRLIAVLVPMTSTFDTRKVKAEVGRLLAPYSEDLEVPEYDAPCECADSIARHLAIECGGDVPPLNGADPNCEECGGKGTVRSTRNLRAEWDGWEITSWRADVKRTRMWVGDLISRIDRDWHSAPYAVVTPDGKWHDEGVLNVLRRHQHLEAVAIDTHQ